MYNQSTKIWINSFIMHVDKLQSYTVSIEIKSFHPPCNSRAEIVSWKAEYVLLKVFDISLFNQTEASEPKHFFILFKDFEFSWGNVYGIRKQKNVY